jgi:diadenosine tetraphosphatase ApaH/serine/threonine PP2A family protein phosphatase
MTAATVKVATLLMRVAVISDVHANYHALQAALTEIDAARVDAVWCLGDTVGYGPRPNECCDLVGDRADYCLVGNHDLVVLGELSVNEFNDEAAAAAIWTTDVLTSESRAFLASLKPLGAVDSVDHFHGSARDPVWEYVLTEEAASATLELSSAPLVLVGHSHVALAITADDGHVSGGPARGGSKIALEGRRLLNPGSVGQPRDGDPRAAWLLLDFEKRFAEFRRVPYSIERTQAEMRERGLPQALAARLERGD